jgi:ribonucleoside-diphosphate reductase alpha chain
MAKDLLTTYKYGWKTSYYQNTMDGKVEDVMVEDLPQDPFNESSEEDCDACAI